MYYFGRDTSLIILITTPIKFVLSHHSAPFWYIVVGNASLRYINSQDDVSCSLSFLHEFQILKISTLLVSFQSTTCLIYKLHSCCSVNLILVSLLSSLLSRLMCVSFYLLSKISKPLMFIFNSSCTRAGYLWISRVVTLLLKFWALLCSLIFELRPDYRLSMSIVYGFYLIIEFNSLNCRLNISVQRIV